jgi:pyridoxine 5-phosphate synthase
VKSSDLRLGVNIDHVATIRNARGGSHPDPIAAALLAVEGGADGITAHLREDRRHITDQDIADLTAKLKVPLNLEMAATAEMLFIALKHKPHAVCLVPERRQERTTEGGLDVANDDPFLFDTIKKLNESNIRVSLFIAPDKKQVDAAHKSGAPVVEFHTGPYAHAAGAIRAKELQRIIDAVEYAHSLGIECHAGHGLTYDNVGPIAAIPQLKELNIGHFLIGEAIFSGLKESIQEMRRIMDISRKPNKNLHGEPVEPWETKRFAAHPSTSSG